MQKASSADKDHVLVEHGFEYTAKDGTRVSITPHERYVLLKKTNEHWWQVCRDYKSKPFYIPAKYVKVLPPFSAHPPGGSRACSEEAADVPSTDYSYKFLPAPVQANLPRSGTALSLCDISVIREDPAQSRTFLGPPLRTFHNSRKIHDPLKRISYMCPPEFHPSIRPSQSLNDLHVISAETPVPRPRQSRLREDREELSIQEGHVTGAERDTPPEKAVSEKEETYYVNLAELRKDAQRSAPSPRCPSSSSTTDDWETHTDQGSGQLFYYNSVTGETTWDCPCDPAEEGPASPAEEGPASPAEEGPASPSPAPSEDSAWEKHFDESSGRYFFYNPVTGDTSWDLPTPDPLYSPRGQPMFSPYDPMDRRPPTPEADYPDDTEEGESFPDADYDGNYISPPHTRTSSEEQLSGGWSYHVKDGQKLYTNNANGDTWIQSQDQYGKTFFYSPDGSLSQWSLPQLLTPDQRAPSDPNQNNMVITSWRTSYSNFSLQKETEMRGLEKAGLLQKAKVLENGKRLRKNWSSSWTVLEGGILTFFKDAKNLSSNSQKQQSLTIPEYTVRLQGASISWASKEKSSKKHVMELRTQDGSEYLVHHDSESITDDWFASIKKCISKNTRIPSENTSENETESQQEFGSTEKLGVNEKKGNTDSDRNVRAKLRKFLTRRPTLQALRDKGYIRDQVFGCPLQHLCERDKRNVPQFVCKSIQAVERRGLDIDGLYRVSGNLAIIQRLRHKVDHEENFNLEDGKWEDVHVITGALKLFFRELPEPLFPFTHFSDFVEAIKLSDQSQKLRRMRDLVLSLPPPNLETMRLLFRHLCSVIEHRESNRMSVQSVAIVFGPTLLRPEEEGGNIAMYMVFQNQIVEHVLNQYKNIFS